MLMHVLCTCSTLSADQEVKGTDVSALTLCGRAELLAASWESACRSRSRELTMFRQASALGCCADGQRSLQRLASCASPAMSITAGRPSRDVTTPNASCFQPAAMSQHSTALHTLYHRILCNCICTKRSRQHIIIMHTPQHRSLEIA